MNATEIKTLRKSLGWTQTKLAEYIGVDQSAVSRWENGKRRPRKLRDITVYDILINEFSNYWGINFKEMGELLDSALIPTDDRMVWYEGEIYPKPSLWSRIKRWLGWR